MSFGWKVFMANMKSLIVNELEEILGCIVLQVMEPNSAEIWNFILES